MKTKNYLRTIVIAINVALLINVGNVMASPSNRGDEPIDKKSMRDINKFIKKEAKKIKKAGFSNEFGAPPVEMQLRESYKMELQRGNDGRKMFIVGTGTAIAGTANAASLHALTDAMLKACILVETKMFGLIENDYNNKQYTREEYQTLSRMKGAFSGIVAKELTGGEPIVVFVRDNGEYYEYQVRVAYAINALFQKTKEKIYEGLGDESNELRKKFEKMTGLDKLQLN